MDPMSPMSGQARLTGHKELMTNFKQCAAACILSFMLAWVCLIHGGAGPATAQSVRSLSSTASPNYPLKVSTNRRYLVDSSNVPFLIIGDAPQTLINKLSLEEATTYMENRRGYGIN